MRTRTFSPVARCTMLTSSARLAGSSSAFGDTPAVPTAFCHVASLGRLHGAQPASEAAPPSAASAPCPKNVRRPTAPIMYELLFGLEYAADFQSESGGTRLD